MSSHVKHGGNLWPNLLDADDFARMGWVGETESIGDPASVLPLLQHGLFRVKRDFLGLPRTPSDRNT